MKRLFSCLFLLAFMALVSSPAEARRHHHNSHHGYSHHHKKHHARLGGRPAKWCGWYMRTIFGGGPQYNRAREWAKRGSSAGGPRVGAVVVWRHHVGLITGRASNGRWIVKSGNDSNRVRERPRSVAGAIAFRML